MLALIHENTIISTVRPGGWFTLPDGSRASPAQDGWSNGEYHLAEIQQADEPPADKIIVNTTVEMIGGQPKYVHELADKPLPPLSASQLRMGLVLNGIPLSSVDAAIDAIADSTEREMARIKWEYAQYYERDHPLLAHVASSLGLTDQKIDEMWQEALGF